MSVISEYSKISEFASFQRKIICSWDARPIALFHEIGFTKLDGSKIFSKNVSGMAITVEVDKSFGNTIIASSRNVSAKIEIFGMSIHIMNFSMITFVELYFYLTFADFQANAAVLLRTINFTEF